ncbi:MAG: glycoside hydrolase family 9 protein [Pirellulales bacterium]|nr:glycoside hydrolase family 9 protein [Pirellulales bacterium]
MIRIPLLRIAAFLAALYSGVQHPVGHPGPFQAPCMMAGEVDTDGKPIAFIRVNQVGYLVEDSKRAIAFSTQPILGTFSLIDHRTGSITDTRPLAVSFDGGWGRFQYYYDLDFSRVKRTGRYVLRIDATGDRSTAFSIGDDAYQTYQDDLLTFLRQQRCGYNPFLDVKCHEQDGRTAYGPLPPGTPIDVTGGWHDAGDQLKYLLTASNATARMLLAYELEPSKFGDRVDRLGHPTPNGVPDVLDEARWGLDWMHKLHPEPDQLYHQVADDRDHTGWKYPDKDNSDYGWGPNSYRVVYYADGKPQGLAKFQSEATGIANLAGRYAAAMAMAHRIWKRDLGDPEFAERCLRAAAEVYRMGRAGEGYQQGNSYRAPYRYLERTWADDMEWGAAELYKVTGETHYLDRAKTYAQKIGATSWMPLETAGHYEFYPFVNVGHFALYPLVDPEFQRILAADYRAGIDATCKRGSRTPFRVGVPFIWCSNNLTVALITQILLYERMTQDIQYHAFMLAQRDWLFGNNPWGTSMFTGIPRHGEYPEDIHTSIWKLTRTMVPGGLVDGPVATSVYNRLIGLHLSEEDEFAEFQNEHAVYHDDIGDYSTNEPTMDGTAGAIYMMAFFGVPDSIARRADAKDTSASTESDRSGE